MEIREISQKSVWEGACSVRVWSQSFLHSWNWGEFQAALGNRVFRLGVFSGETVEGLALLVKVCARRGSFLLCPHGPLLSDFRDGELRSALFTALKNLGIRETVSFIRLCPLLPASRENDALFTEAGFRNAPIHMMHPELTWNLDLAPSEETLMAGMRKTTRYLVRRASKMGVTVSQSSDDSFLREFYRIHEDTVERQRFVPFSFEYLQKEMEAFRGDEQISVFLAKHEGQVISGAVIVFYGKTAFYHHGASLSAFREVPASYLVQWRIIQEAKRRGLSVYNFWGISPDDRPNHPWAGLSLFKKGFGGYSENYLHAKDLVLKPNYWLTWAIEKARRVKRGL
ncbi:peptidoglycan bridge formation glycyltransferase FemA/FemB family protein [Candidatus Peregrinibacteria bacterium]|nr:peptidoglycan bridge formation glycyltransferase FemA/FemB family protein [Candidatus Peregrinibacteria bacterium]